MAVKMEFVQFRMPKEEPDQKSDPKFGVRYGKQRSEYRAKVGKKIKCPECPKVFRDNYDKNVHMKSIHGDKPKKPKWRNQTRKLAKIFLTSYRLSRRRFLGCQFRVYFFI